MYESFKGGRASFWVQAACFGPLFTQCIDISLATFDCSPPHNAEIFTSTHAVIGQHKIFWQDAVAKVQNHRSVCVSDYPVAKTELTGVLTASQQYKYQ